MLDLSQVRFRSPADRARFIAAEVARLARLRAEEDQIIRSGRGYGRALWEINHWDVDGTLLSRGVSWNLITNAGRQFLHQQGYAKTGLASNGLCYFAFSADAVTETATSTTLSNEITTNGLARTIADTVSLPTGSGNQTVLSILLAVTGSQSVQKMALFSASSSGTMSHVNAAEQGTISAVSGQKISGTANIFLG